MFSKCLILNEQADVATTDPEYDRLKHVVD